MRLEHIVLNNIKRRKGRAAFLLLGLMIGVATVVSLLSLSSALSMHAQHEMEQFGANIMITPQTDHLSLSYGGVNLGGVSLTASEIPQDSLAAIDTIRNRRNIAAIAPKVLGAVDLKGQHVLLMGVDPKVEFGLKQWWSVSGRPMSGSDELVIGSAAARQLDVAMGETLDLNGRSFTIVGILNETGSQDDQLILADLATAQTLLGKQGVVTMVEIAALCHDCPVEDMVRQLQEVLPGIEVQAVQQVVKTRMHAIAQFQLLSYGVAAVVMLVGALLVFVTMMGAVSERTREIGIYRAIGFRRFHVLRLVLVESAVISAGAGLLGYLLGIGVTLGALPLLSDSPTGWHFDPIIAVGALVAAILVGLLAALQPAFRASRLEPSEALRAL